MKKLILILLILAMSLFALAACGGTGDGGEEGGSGDGGTSEGGSGDGGSETPAPVEYTITWISENGTTLKTESVKEGVVPSYSYSVSDTAEWDYTFNGWATSAGGQTLSSIPAASANASYYALVSKTKQVYTVSFNTLGGDAVASQSVEYGSKANEPIAPKYEGHKFVGWSSSQTELVEVDFDATITKNVEYFAVWNEVADVKAMLSALIAGYKLDPYSYIPDSMKLNYSANLVDSADIVTDYSNFVSVSDITYGIGEQWFMVLENLNQSELFFNVLSVVDTISTASVTAFNNYFDSNPDNVAHYDFENGIYNIAINFDGEIISYVIDYTASLPALGETNVQIALAMVVETGEKTVRIQLGETNALKYTVGEGYYNFAITYLGVRCAMLSISSDDDGNVNGKIYEYLTVAGKDLSSSAAEFYITEDYVSVVGNKADGMIGFTGTICELYSVDSGKMVAYEINEAIEVLGVPVSFNTLWFNLDSIDGIDSIKFIPKTNQNEAKLFVNESDEIWQTKNVGGFSPKTASRRFDIEFRTQYVVSYDAATEKYTTHKISVPMLFVQEENFDSLADDVESVNEDVNVSVTVADASLDKLLEDYDELIPVFNENKEIFTKELILAYIGGKIIFE